MINHPCFIHYAQKNRLPNPKWRERPGIIRTVSPPGRHPRNVLVMTDIGPVVVPRWNVRLDKNMSNTADIINILKTLRVNPVAEEYDLQRQIAAELKKANIEFIPEYRIGKRNRVDFMAIGGIVIEVKKGKPYTGNVIAQLQRYAAFPEVKAIILVVETSLMHLPRTVNGKPFYCLGLNKLWGIAL